MATYKKKLKTLEVHLMLNSQIEIIADTATDDMATRALNEFKNYGTMHYAREAGGFKITDAIPYHAVQCIKVTETVADITKADPYGCEDGGGDTVTVTFEGFNEVTVQVPLGTTLDEAERIAVTNGFESDAEVIECGDGDYYNCTVYAINGKDGYAADYSLTASEAGATIRTIGDCCEQ